ncbi:MAG: NADH-quinone oxidoreductase subunit NuoE [Candidatus Caldatribacteriota bacterium]|jgi:NADH-quinone oxidoreductase E subunit|nr:NADH-quinone oxidoreductase subunit NuoE [Verrucomicrobiota bacterium]MDD2353410.1 NADH-quinone oxidoreductase subunit NuoE [Atribacterota bacterium]MDD3031940.1 NADH-quinone oxidoreductase subunit NuoE [Atribacterota bacterium]MDD3641787.1 NADH-quinone oxidoreductase subunit NuoE [Atribacterota bacterium]MDD4289575.1 NADH-quinone oxidoreductase subunit NuoE [Atribacterota bacterium]
MSETTTISKSDELSRQENYRQLEDFINENKEKKGYLIPILYKAQELFKYLPPEVMSFVAKGMGISESEVFGVATFYSYFKTKPIGRHTITVCMGTACYVKGAKKILEELQNKLGIKEGETTKDLRFTLGSQPCFGSCGMAPVIMIDNNVHGRLTPDKLDEVLQKYK